MVIPYVQGLGESIKNMCAKYGIQTHFKGKAQADTLSSCSYALFIQTKYKINSFYILSVINQTQDEAFNINDNFWSISTPHFSYSIKLHFPYNIIYLPNGCKGNAIAFVLPSNNKLNIEPIIETPYYKLGFNIILKNK